MKKLKIISIVGARPQFIKVSVIDRAFKLHNKLSTVKVSHTIIHTGQHFDKKMSKIFFDEMKITEPKINLEINSVSHGKMVGKQTDKIEEYLVKRKPDLVIVYGDTNSTLAGVIAAKKLQIKVAHIEAGLRSNNITMPEEQNRLVADRLSDILFCPTKLAFNNLKKENIHNSPYGQKAYIVGDVMYDAALFFSKLGEEKDYLSALNISRNKYILTTIHRAENTNNAKKLKEIFSALNELAEKTDIVLPLHPATRNKLHSFKINLDKIKILSPVSYLEMIHLEKNCKLIMTDSGGVQKEAYFFKKYCITLRDETEWQELLDHKVNKLVGSSYQNIINAYYDSQTSLKQFDKKFYGSGSSGEKIVKILLKN